MIKITCPSCRRVHKSDESLLGKRVKCKDCGFTFEVMSNGPQPVQQPNAGEVKQITPIKGRPIEQQWYWMQNGQKNGPVVGIVGLKELAGSGRLKPTDMIWRDGLPNWVRASQVKGLCPDQTSTANGQAAGEPVPAPVATEVPHPHPLLSPPKREVPLRGNARPALKKSKRKQTNVVFAA